MAYHLCSSPSSFCHDRQSLFNSLSSSRKLRLTNFSCPFKLNSLSLQSRTSLQITQVSVQDPIPQQSLNPNSSQSPNHQSPDGKTPSPSKSYIWVNPRSTRASQLRQHSYDARYASLVKVAESLNSGSPTDEAVSSVLIGLGDNILEQDAVIVLNNMSNLETAPLALKFFQQKLKPHREVVLYNVTLKVFRKCRDFSGAEKLFDEMLQRGVKYDNITFST